MSVVIRLARHGAKKRPIYRMVAADKEKKRDGRFLEVLGTYDPKKKDIDNFKKERVTYWLKQGAKPSERVTRLIKNAGISVS